MAMIPVFKRILLATSITLALQGCGDSGSPGRLSREQVQFSTHMDQARFYLKQGQLRASIEEAHNALRLNPEHPEPHLVIAENLLTAGDMRGAARHYRNLFTPDAENGIEVAEPSADQRNRALLGLASANLMLRNFDEANAALGQMQEPSQELHLKALVLRGDLALAQGRADEARGHYERAREQDPNHIGALIALSRLAALHRDDETALRLIREAEQIAPEDSDLWLWKAHFADSRNRYTEAEEAYVKALDDIGRYDLMTYQKYQTISRLVAVLRAQGKASEAFVYEEILAKSVPGAVKAGYEAALAYYKEGNLDGAAQELEKVLEQAPGHTDSGILLGMVRYAQGDFARADQLLSRYGSAENPAIAKVLAAAKIKMQQPAEAANILKQIQGLEQDPELLSLLGIASLANGDTKAGLENIERSLALNPDNTDLRLRLARYHLSTNASEPAIAQLQQILAKDKDHRQAKSLLVSAYARSGQTEQAESLARAWLKDSPNDTAALNALGSLAAQRKDDQNAQRYFMQAHQADPKDSQALLNLAALEMRREDWASAQSWYSKVLEADGENLTAIRGLLDTARRQDALATAIQFLEQYFSQHPNAVNARLAVAEVEAMQGDSTRTLELLSQAEQVSDDKHRVASLGHNILRIAIERGISGRNFDSARSLLDQALKQHPDSLELGLLAARLEFLAGKPEQGFGHLTKVRSQHADSPAPLELEGDYHVVQGDFGKALDAYRKAWDLQHTQDLAIKLHQVLRQMDQVDASMEPLQNWLREQPESPRALALLAMAYQSKGQFDQAIAHYEQVRRLQPKDALALNNLAWLYQETGNPQAESTARVAYDLSPENAAIADTYGWILLRNNKVQESLPVLEKALELGPDVKEIAEHLAEAYRKAKLPDKAAALQQKYNLKQ